MSKPAPNDPIWLVDDKGNKELVSYKNRVDLVMPDDLIATYEKGFMDGRRRGWVEFTDEQIGSEVEKELTHYWNGEYIDTTGARDRLTVFAQSIQAKLKEKNT